MIHQQIAARQQAQFQRAFGPLFEDSSNPFPEFTPEHLKFLEVRRDRFFQLLVTK